MKIYKGCSFLLSLLLCGVSLAGCNDLNTTSTAGNTYVYTYSENYTLNLSSGKKSTSSKSSTKSNANSSTKNSSRSTANTSSLKEYSYKVSKFEPYLTLNGRAFCTDLAAVLDWDCSSVSFSAVCEKSLSLTFSADGDQTAYLRIWLDSKEVEPSRVAVDEKHEVKVTLAENLKRQTHTVKILRTTSANAPSVSLEEIQMTGSFVNKTATKKKSILFIGDGTLCGNGNLLNDSYFSGGVTYTNKMSARQNQYQDTSQAFPYITANALNMDYEIVARKDVGFGAGFFSGETIFLSDLYRLRSVNDISYPAIKKQYNVIVIGGGRADLVTTTYLSPKCTNSVVAAQDFCQMLQDENPGAKIVWCYGMDTDDDMLLNNFDNLINKRLGGTKKGIYGYKFKRSNRVELCSAKEHAAYAKELTAFIRSIT